MMERGPLILYIVWLGMVSYQLQDFRPRDSILRKYLGCIEPPLARS